MKNVFIFAILVFITSCNDDLNSSKASYFNPENLEQLSIKGLDKFWRGDSIFIDDYKGYFFNEYDGYLDGLTYVTDSTHKKISVYVFKSRDIAIKAMEEFRLVIVAPTYEGDPNLYFNEKWWYVAGTPYNSITVNKYNTLIQVFNSFSENDNLVIETTDEIISRIEKLSK